MPTITQLSEVRPLVTTPTSNPDLEVIIERVESELMTIFGVTWNATDKVWLPVTEAVKGGGSNLFVKMKIGSISSISEGAIGSSSLSVVDPSQYYAWMAQGRIEKASGSWLSLAEVTYVPDFLIDKFKAVVIDVLRITLSRSGVESESVTGSHSYRSLDWDEALAKGKRRLGFIRI